MNFANLNSFGIIGDAVASVLTDSIDNSFLGHNAGSSVITGWENTLLGAETDCSVNAVNQSSFGYQAIAVSDNTMILGNNDISVGIGMSSATPTAKLHVKLAPSAIVVPLPVAERIENSDIETGVV